SVIIGAPSPTFKYAIATRKEMATFITERIERLVPRPPGATISGLFERSLTLRVSLPEEVEGFDLDEHEATALMESCLFELSYLRNISFQVQTEWPSVRLRRRNSMPGRLFRGSPLPLKLVDYDISPLRFYQRAIAVDDAYVKFISFYHVLEYYFVTVSD